MISAQLPLEVSTNSCPAKMYNTCKFYGSEKSTKLYDKYQKMFRYLQRHTGNYFPRNNMAETVTRFLITYDALFNQVSENTRYITNFILNAKAEFKVIKKKML